MGKDTTDSCDAIVTRPDVVNADDQHDSENEEYIYIIISIPGGGKRNA